MILYLITFAEGILTFVSPCILPMLPVYFLYLAGRTEDNTAYVLPKAKAGRRRLILNSLGFATGFTFVFVLLGAASATLGGFLGANRPILQKISGTIMILFGLNFTGALKIGFLNREKRIGANFRNTGVFGSILFGIIFGLGWSPCIGTFLGSALMLAGNTGTATEGILLLLVYSAGLAVPFVLSAAIFKNLQGVFGWLKRNGRIISIISGILLIAAGFLLFTGNMNYLF